MCLTSNLFQTFTIPSEISTTWPTILHREELPRPPPPPAGRQQRREAEGNLRSIIILIIINFDTCLCLHQHYCHRAISLFGPGSTSSHIRSEHEDFI